MVSKESLELKKQILLQNKTPENSQYTNSRIGLIDTMIRLGKYCLYNIFEM